MKTLKEFKNEQMTDREFAEEYQALQPELDVIKAIKEEKTGRILPYLFSHSGQAPTV